MRALALITLLLAFSRPLSADSRRPHESDSGTPMETADYRADGWWQDGPPDWMTGPALYPPEAVAASSPACMKLLDDKPEGWRESAAQCATRGYETVHLYLSLSGDSFIVNHAEKIAEKDPWRVSPSTRDRVYLLHTEKIEDVLEAVKRLLAQCKIASFVHIDAHGLPGGIDVGHDQAYLITDFVRNRLTPCLLAPGAKVQFASCYVACGDVAGAVRNGLEKVFSDPGYRSDPNQAPLESVSLLLNTDAGWTAARPDWVRFFGFSPIDEESANGEALVYTYRAGRMRTNIPVAQVPRCSEHALDLWHPAGALPLLLQDLDDAR